MQLKGGRFHRLVAAMQHDVSVFSGGVLFMHRLFSQKPIVLNGCKNNRMLTWPIPIPWVWLRQGLHHNQNIIWQFWNPLRYVL